MGKFFIFTIILSSILIAHVICPSPPKIKKSAEPETNQPTADVDNSEVGEMETGDGNNGEYDGDEVANQEEEEEENEELVSGDEETEDTADINEEEADDSRWILKYFDKTKVDQVKRGKKCWGNSDVEVCLRKDSSSVRVSWESNTDIIHIDVFDNGDIKQNFYFTDWQTDLGYNVAFDITIEKCSKCGTQTEIWKFPRTKLLLSKGADGAIQKRWVKIEDLQLLKKYKGYIKAWCAHNEFFIGEGNCVITYI